MEWRSIYSVGIEEIDNHHKQLLRHFSSIEDAIATSQGWSAIHYGIVEARQFADFHFRFEEALMRLYGYAECDEHAEAHRKILQKIEDIEQSTLQADAAEGLLKFFRDWLLNHIQHADRGYAQHILMGAKVVVPDDFKPLS
ncbi:MAG: bacteriohemerythrin [Rhodocyclales bacterium]|nr:bacteriohemerythrin [Rhodocyclales bacterium]